MLIANVRIFNQGLVKNRGGVRVFVNSETCCCVRIQKCRGDQTSARHSARQTKRTGEPYGGLIDVNKGYVEVEEPKQRGYVSVVCKNGEVERVGLNFKVGAARDGKVSTAR